MVISIKKPENPDEAIVNQYLTTWEDSEEIEKYREQEKSLKLLFFKLCRYNTSLEHVLLKVSVLNDFYSTNIYDTNTVSKHILELNIDKRLECGDFSVVHEIAKVKNRNFYSFASKYCSHHQPDRYPIYDSYVEKTLWHFHKIDKFAEFKKNELKSYRVFVDIINRFKKFYRLQNFSLRQIDIYLWLCGREYFPKVYK